MLFLQFVFIIYYIFLCIQFYIREYYVYTFYVLCVIKLSEGKSLWMSGGTHHSMVGWGIDWGRSCTMLREISLCSSLWVVKFSNRKIIWLDTEYSTNWDSRIMYFYVLYYRVLCLYLSFMFIWDKGMTPLTVDAVDDNTFDYETVERVFIWDSCNDYACGNNAVDDNTVMEWKRRQWRLGINACSLQRKTREYQNSPTCRSQWCRCINLMYVYIYLPLMMPVYKFDAIWFVFVCLHLFRI